MAAHAVSWLSSVYLVFASATWLTRVNCQASPSLLGKRCKNRVNSRVFNTDELQVLVKMTVHMGGHFALTPPNRVKIRVKSRQNPKIRLATRRAG
jgi:hypothetical protein